MRRTAIVLIVAAALLGACSDSGYLVKPVVGPDDTRKTDVPDIDDSEAVEAQDCFEIEIWESHAFSSDDKVIGIACMVEEDR